MNFFFMIEIFKCILEYIINLNTIYIQKHMQVKKKGIRNQNVRYLIIFLYINFKKIYN